MTNWHDWWDLRWTTPVWFGLEIVALILCFAWVWWGGWMMGRASGYRRGREAEAEAINRALWEAQQQQLAHFREKFHFHEHPFSEPQS